MHFFQIIHFFPSRCVRVHKKVFDMTRPRGDNGGNGGRGGGNRGSGGRNRRKRGRGRGGGRGNTGQPAYQPQRKTSQEENIISWKGKDVMS